MVAVILLLAAVGLLVHLVFRACDRDL